MPFSKYSPKQKKLARIAEPRDAITGADFAALKKKPKKMAGGGTIASVKKRYDNAIKRKVADIQKRTKQTEYRPPRRTPESISRAKQAELKGDMFVDEQEFKVKDIPTPKI